MVVGLVWFSLRTSRLEEETACVPKILTLSQCAWTDDCVFAMIIQSHIDLISIRGIDSNPTPMESGVGGRIVQCLLQDVFNSQSQY